MSPVGIILIILVVAVIATIANRMERKRREMLAAWAAKRGWTLDTGKRRGMDKVFPGLKILDKGHSKRAKNTITGQLDGRNITLTDYTYVTGQGKNRSTHQVGLLILEADHPTIPLFIRREHALDKVGGFLGMDDIDFESAEFSGKFYVKSADRKWAYDIIHTRTMEYLLSAPSYTIEFGYGEIAVYRSRHAQPDRYEEAMSVAARMLDLIPEYVVLEMKGKSR